MIILFHKHFSLILLSLLIIGGNAYSQSYSFNVEISANQNKDSLYAKVGNEVRIFIKDSFKIDSATYAAVELFVTKLKLTSSEGKLVQLDRNTRYALRGLKKGEVTLRAFKNVDTGVQLLTTKTYVVTKAPKNVLPLAYLAGAENYQTKTYYSNSDWIPASVAHKARKICVRRPLKFGSAVVYLTGPSFAMRPFFKKFANGKFDKEIRHKLKQVKAGDTIVIDEIKVIVDSNTRMLPSMVFNVVADSKE